MLGRKILFQSQDEFRGQLHVMIRTLGFPQDVAKGCFRSWEQLVTVMVYLPRAFVELWYWRPPPLRSPSFASWIPGLPTGLDKTLRSMSGRG